MKLLLLSLLLAFVACAGVQKAREVAGQEDKKEDKETKKKSQQYRGTNWDTPMERF